MLYEKGNHKQELSGFFSMYVGNYIIDNRTGRRRFLKSVDGNTIQGTMKPRKAGGNFNDNITDYKLCLKDISNITEYHLKNACNTALLDFKKHGAFLKALLQQLDLKDIQSYLSMIEISFTGLMSVVEYLRQQGYYFNYRNIDFKSVVIFDTLNSNLSTSSIISGADESINNIYTSSIKPTSEWLPIPRFEKLYEVSIDGDVWDVKHKNHVNTFVMPHTKLLFCMLKKGEETFYFPVKRIVANLFMSDTRRDDAITILNLDDDFQDNKKSNLSWSRLAMNEELITKESDQSVITVTRGQVLNIRDQYFFFNCSIELLALKYNLPKKYVTKIINRKLFNTI